MSIQGPKPMTTKEKQEFLRTLWDVFKENEIVIEHAEATAKMHETPSRGGYRQFTRDGFTFNCQIDATRRKRKLPWGPCPFLLFLAVLIPGCAKGPDSRPCAAVERFQITGGPVVVQADRMTAAGPEPVELTLHKGTVIQMEAHREYRGPDAPANPDGMAKKGEDDAKTTKDRKSVRHELTAGLGRFPGR